jgi:hypothetical protein
MKAKRVIERLQQLAREKGRPVRVRFTTRHCGWGACEGFHPVEALVFYPDGRVEHWPSPYGLHSRVYPTPRGREVDLKEAARIAAQLLQKERTSTRDPFLSWERVLDGAEVLEE